MNRTRRACAEAAAQPNRVPMDMTLHDEPIPRYDCSNVTSAKAAPDIASRAGRA